jgi:preprotein translocase subunit SecG
MKTFPLHPLLIAISTLLISSTALQAGTSNKSGNPYGNGSFFNTAGTFNGVLRGVDILGVTQFSTSTNATLNAGPLSIYNANNGNGTLDDTWFVYPTLDPSANTLTAVLAGSTNPIYGTYTHPTGAGGYFNASLHTAPPNQTYSGTGAINLLGNGTNQVFTINGTRISN